MKEKHLANLSQATVFALVFIERAEIAINAFEDGTEDHFHSKSFAAAKRASMDLTRALAQLRKSPYADQNK